MRNRPFRSNAVPPADTTPGITVANFEAGTVDNVLILVFDRDQTEKASVNEALLCIQYGNLGYLCVYYIMKLNESSPCVPTLKVVAFVPSLSSRAAK